jgi:long-subunit fatty acid transport protein
VPEINIASLRRAVLALVVGTFAATSIASAVGAQQQPTAPRDTTRARADSGRVAPDTARADSARAAGPRRARAAVVPRAGLEPPISPRRAFISSLLVPGLGQARLDRPSAGALFVTVELAAIAMATKAAYDLRAAKAFRADSVVLSYPVDTATGLPTARPQRGEGPFPNELVRARRLHLEDWIAVLGFNHLIAGAEAFVAANLWDLPAQVGAQRSRRGPTVVVTVPW